MNPVAFSASGHHGARLSSTQRQVSLTSSNASPSSPYRRHRRKPAREERMSRLRWRIWDGERVRGPEAADIEQAEGVEPLPTQLNLKEISPE